MKISARNTLSGTVHAVTLGGVELTATITRASDERLGLEVGKAAHAVIKASDVMIAVGRRERAGPQECGSGGCGGGSPRRSLRPFLGVTPVAPHSPAR